MPLRKNKRTPVLKTPSVFNPILFHNANMEKYLSKSLGRPLIQEQGFEPSIINYKDIWTFFVIINGNRFALLPRIMQIYMLNVIEDTLYTHHVELQQKNITKWNQRKKKKMDIPASIKQKDHPKDKGVNLKEEDAAQEYPGTEDEYKAAF
ncbi:hypothetical protein Godav_029859 [Gossypium davidsonii]|uniref:Uncharacterized protein n=1 Tax=Gossypium davidsonii TaxID=34287 RepID=A0A7J8TK59_GOSDV|nr:hypothetical protein [Gossypium davidsonii]